MLVKAYMDTYKFPANITNCSNNYGPYQFPEKLIPLIINNALQGKDLPVYGDGKNVRDWLYVEDHAKGIDMVQEQGKLFETYNIGGHNEKQNIQIIHIILDTLQEMLPDGDPRKELVSENLIKYVTDRKGHDRRYAEDCPLFTDRYMSENANLPILKSGTLISPTMSQSVCLLEWVTEK